MNTRIVLLLGVLIVSGCASSRETIGIAMREDGLPDFQTVNQAIHFVVVEANVSNYTGLVQGSEEYKVALPSGRAVSNWLIDCYFMAAFQTFGRDAYPQLADLLNHEHEFVRVGVFAVLNQFMYSHGLRYNYRQDETERLTVIGQLKTLLNKD